MTRAEFAPRMTWLQQWMAGADVEMRYKGVVPAFWHPIHHAHVFTESDCEFRAKPKPREWWICGYCARAYQIAHCPTSCLNCRHEGTFTHVREVLPTP